MYLTQDQHDFRDALKHFIAREMEPIEGTNQIHRLIVARQLLS
jgi:hypothetical protein